MRYVVWLNNRVDRADDEWIGVEAKDKRDAVEIAEQNCSSRFELGTVYTIKQFCKDQGKFYLPREWHW